MAAVAVKLKSRTPNSYKLLDLCYSGMNDVIKTFWDLTMRRAIHTSVVLAGGRPKSHWRQNREPALTKLRLDKKQKVTERKAYGGDKKFKALKINRGLYQWKSQDVEYVSPILRVVHCSANKNFPRQGIMVKGTIVEIDGSRFKEWYSEEQECKSGDSDMNDITVDVALSQQLLTGKLYAKITSRPGQEGNCNGYILEGNELNDFISNAKVKLANPRSYPTENEERTT